MKDTSDNIKMFSPPKFNVAFYLVYVRHSGILCLEKGKWTKVK